MTAKIDIYKNLPTLWAEIKATESMLLENPDDEFLLEKEKSLKNLVGEIESLIEERSKKIRELELKVQELEDYLYYERMGGDL